MRFQQAATLETFEYSQANTLLNSLNILFCDGGYFVKRYLTVRIFYKHTLNNYAVKMWVSV